LFSLLFQTDVSSIYKTAGTLACIKRNRLCKNPSTKKRASLL
jgi:hypothetical protein